MTTNLESPTITDDESYHSGSESGLSDDNGPKLLERKKAKRRNMYVDFDKILEAVDLVIQGTSVYAAARAVKLPYHRVYMYIKENYPDSSDEEEVCKSLYFHDILFYFKF